MIFTKLKLRNKLSILLFLNFDNSKSLKQITNYKSKSFTVSKTFSFKTNKFQMKYRIVY